MCMICNISGPSPNAGFRFLEAFEASQHWMKRAERAILQCSKEATTDTARWQYGRVHRKMVRLRRAWNTLEHQREVYTDADMKAYLAHRDPPPPGDLCE